MYKGRKINKLFPYLFYTYRYDMERWDLDRLIDTESDKVHTRYNFLISYNINKR